MLWGQGGGGRRLPWAVLGAGEPDTLESQSLVSTGESQTHNVRCWANRGRRQGSGVGRVVRGLWEEALFEAVALRSFSEEVTSELLADACVRVCFGQ